MLNSLYLNLPLQYVKGTISSKLIYPLAQIKEKRKISEKIQELRSHYSLKYEQRKKIAIKNLIDSIEFAQENVPYYKNLFNSIHFHSSKLYQDLRYLEDIPFLTKDIIRENQNSLLSSDLSDTRHHLCRTSGSTGKACKIYYDVLSTDYSSAVNVFCREKRGKKHRHPEIHFASLLPGQTKMQILKSEFFKNFAMNRDNVFITSLDEESLLKIINCLNHKKPYLIHAHSSTIYALACYAEKLSNNCKSFTIFESTGETLEPYMKMKIEQVFQCKTVNRYGLAETGVIGYELNENDQNMLFLDSECWPEQIVNENQSELVVTTFRNKLMPLIRYKTGDSISLADEEDGLYIKGLVGRMHDLIKIGNKVYPTHHIMDVLDHSIGKIIEFQIDTRESPYLLSLVVENNADIEQINSKVNTIWPNAFKIVFVDHSQLKRVGRLQKFRHII